MTLVTAGRLENEAFYSAKRLNEHEEIGNAFCRIGKACRAALWQNTNIEGRFRYVDADKTGSISHEAGLPYTRARSSLNGSTKPQRCKGFCFFYERKSCPHGLNHFAPAIVKCDNTTAKRPEHVNRCSGLQCIRPANRAGLFVSVVLSWFILPRVRPECPASSPCSAPPEDRRRCGKADMRFRPIVRDSRPLPDGSALREDGPRA